MEHEQSIAAATAAPAQTHGGLRRRLPSLLWVRAALVVLYLVCVAGFYTPGAGFTRLIMFTEDGAPWEIPVLRRTPHAAGAKTGGYDGNYYAQIALDPLLKDPAIDKVLDSPPYRARRILFSWVAWLLGLGRPYWILQVYSLENVAAWLLFAWWLHRRFPSPDVKSLLVWGGCLFCHGILVSTRLALLDGPSLLVLVLAVSAIERKRMLAGTLLIGAAGLGRETNLLGALAIPPPWPPSAARLLKWGACMVLVVLPTLVWMDYLRSIYRSAVFAATGGFSLRLADLARYCRLTLAHIAGNGISTPAWWALLALVSMGVQTLFLATRVRWRNPWWRLGIGYVLLMLALDRAVWEGNPGAFTRVLLPMQVAFNLLVVDSPRFWWLFPIGNLTVLSGLLAIQAPFLSRLF